MKSRNERSMNTGGAAGRVRWEGLADPPEIPEGLADWADPRVRDNAVALYRAWRSGGRTALAAKLRQITATRD